MFAYGIQYSYTGISIIKGLQEIVHLLHYWGRQCVITMKRWIFIEHYIISRVHSWSRFALLSMKITPVYDIISLLYVHIKQISQERSNFTLQNRSLLMLITYCRRDMRSEMAEDQATYTRLVWEVLCSSERGIGVTALVKQQHFRIRTLMFFTHLTNQLLVTLHSSLVKQAIKT